MDLLYTKDIAKSLARILNLLLGMINSLDIKDSGDLLNKINDINMENKSLASLDVKLLCTNILVHKCIKCLEIPPKKSKGILHYIDKSIIRSNRLREIERSRLTLRETGRCVMEYLKLVDINKII